MLKLDNIRKTWPAKAGAVHALDDVSLSVQQGELVTIKGPSGCGKSTLLLAAGAMQRPSSGKVLVDGTDIYALTPTARGAFRREKIGFVFQLFHLVPYLSVRENVQLAASTPAAQDRIDALIDELGLGARSAHRPAELSAGERQRTALARALVNQPRLLLADEPTGNLDPENAATVVKHLGAYRDAGGTVLVVTHGTDADAVADRCVRLNQGKLVGGET